MTGAETEDDIPLGERKTVTDFCYLLDKSKQLFNGLRSERHCRLLITHSLSPPETQLQIQSAS